VGNEIRRSAPESCQSVPHLTVEEIALRLDIGRLAVYTMLEQGIIPAVRLGRRWIVIRHAFENWERTCGMPTGLQRRPEPKVT
jgi:excisionase family DNA binding protein